MVPEESSRRALADAVVGLLGETGVAGVVPVRGESMLPTLREGARVRVDFAPGALRFGDLLLFRQQDYLVVHRFVGRGKPGDGGAVLRCRGDGRPALDPPVPLRSVVGRVVAVERPDGWRSTKTARGRLYGALLGAHGLFWAAATHVAERAESLLGRAGLRLPLRRVSTALDGFLLRAGDAVLFNRMHPRVARGAVPETGKGA